DEIRLAEKYKKQPPVVEEQSEDPVEKQLKLGVIRASKSEWAAAPHFVKKKTGEWRCVLDYWMVNQSMTADSYPLPQIWDHLRAAAGRQRFTTLDMNSGFRNVPIAEESKHLTAFVTPFGLFEFNVIPFGIKNSPAEFQRAMDMVFEEVLDDRTLCYIDDIIIATDRVPEMMQRLEKVLRLCTERGFHLRLDKSEWLMPEVKYLGHKIGRQGIARQERKIGNALNTPAPISRKELQSFLGAVGYVRPFIPRFA
ncbi:retrovirus polyprotein, partial [Gregarina niphandrodes]